MSAGTVDRRHGTYAAWADHVRRRFGRITAFRMGYVIGEASVDTLPACPWTNPRSITCFRQGFDAARDHLERFWGQPAEKNDALCRASKKDLTNDR